MKRAPDRWPTWRRPRQYGYGEAIQSAGMVVAPLLAGFSVTVTVLVIDRTNDFWLPDLTLLLLVGAATTLVIAIQCAYAARQYLVGPDEIESWWPGLDEDDKQASDDRDMARADQFGHRAFHSVWARRFRLTYHSGIVLILSALATMLLPPGHIPPLRWAAFALAVLGVLAEIAWISATELVGEQGAKDPLRKELAAPAPTRGSFISRIAARIVPPYQAIDPPDVAKRKRAAARDAVPQTSPAGGFRNFVAVVAVVVLQRRARHRSRSLASGSRRPQHQ